MIMNKDAGIEPRLITAKQLAAYLNFPLSTVYMMVEQRQIPFKRFGKKAIRFDRNAIDQWIDQHYERSYRVG